MDHRLFRHAHVDGQTSDEPHHRQKHHLQLLLDHAHSHPKDTDLQSALDRHRRLDVYSTIFNAQIKKKSPLFRERLVQTHGQRIRDLFARRVRRKCRTNQLSRRAFSKGSFISEPLHPRRQQIRLLQNNSMIISYSQNTVGAFT